MKVEHDSALAWLLALESHQRDAGLVTRLRRAAWTWQQVERIGVVELVALAGLGCDAGLVAHRLTITGTEGRDALDALLEAPDTPELVMLAAETVEAAERVGVEEVRCETLGLLREVPTAAERAADRQVLTDLTTDLRRLEATRIAMRSRVDAEVAEVRERGERAEKELAAARARASLESSRVVTGLELAASRAVLQEQRPGR